MSLIELRPIHKIALGAAAAAAASGVYLLQKFDPNAVDSPFPPCIFHAFTGYYCIGCGLTRALHALVHGDMAGAFGMNPLGMLVLFLAPLMVAWSAGWQPQALRPLMKVVLEPRLWLIVLPLYWIARNLPWFPFTLLAPGGG